ncbi:MAG: hypothetical protein CMO66_04465 [Verrucomicrobiales bacterium]|nr:hypothetical protein [Verrucomicrobiales bacterium]
MKDNCLRNLLAVAALAALQMPAAEKITKEQAEFFESKIRAIFVDNCYECHSADSRAKADLYLDSKAGMVAGGDSGPALKPGDPDGSLFIKRVKSAVDPMPPSGQPLTEGQIADLEAWVRMGAPDPRGGNNAAVIKSLADREKAKKHWAFQPVKMPDIPDSRSIYGGKLRNWAQDNPIDAFVLRKLDEQGMLPSRPADRQQLIRRAYYDVLGVPPTYAEVQSFVNDTDPEAWDKVVDRLLASPHYGERWGRYWLDVARYADTTGEGNRRGGRSEFIYAWTYRDWVIQAMNSDMPYDEFLKQQIAADRVLEKNENTPKFNLAAMGFLTLGRRDRSNEEVIDDRIDVVTRGALGLSVYCARCHNHKFDPVPTADYYSLYGVFNSSQEPSEENKPILIEDANTNGFLANPEYREFQAKLAGMEYEHEQFKLRTRYEWENQSRTNAFRYMTWAEEFSDNDKEIGRNKGEFRDKTKKFKLKAEIAENWQRYLNRKREDDPVMGPWVAYAKLPPAQFPRQVRRVAAKILEDDTKRKGNRKLNPLVKQYLVETPPSSLNQAAIKYQQLFNQADVMWRQVIGLYQRKMAADPDLGKPNSLADAEKKLEFKYPNKETTVMWEPIRRVVYGNGSPADYPFDRIKRMDRGLERQEQQKFTSKIEDLKKNHNGSPPRAMVLEDKNRPANERIMIKGNRGMRGDEAPRQFLEILSGEDRQPFPNDTSGRLQLAEAIASKDNPLTARVMANRIWLNHFGRGIVNTPNEFGLRAETPSHPELIDWLAAYFMGNQGGPEWSMKKLHRLILTSNTYQQSSDDNPRYSRKDPDNMFLFKTSRRRLGFEAFRDGLLSVSGRIDTTMGGRPIKLSGESPNYRRTIYGYIDRRNLDDIFTTFDFANPDATAGARAKTTVAQQALFMMNIPLIADLSSKLVNRPEFRTAADDRLRIAMLYRLVFQRDPEPIEVKLGERFIAEETGGHPTVMGNVNTWYNGYGSAVYNEQAKIATVRFFSFPYTDGKVWQGSARRPDPQFGNMHLAAREGHPGQNHAVIRRWIAPRDTTVNISGTLEHFLDDKAKEVWDNYKDRPKAEKDALDRAWDGVSGFIVHSQVGRGYDRFGKQLWKGEAKRGRRGTGANNITVKRGDMIDFVVTSRNYIYQDNFRWNPVIRVTDEVKQAIESNAASKLVTEWTASDEFEGETFKAKPLTHWEKYVQVLLLSNELAFVD